MALFKKAETAPAPEQRDASTEISRRLLILEDRYGNIRKQIQFMEEQLLKHQHGMKKEATVIDQTLGELHVSMTQMVERIQRLSNELGSCAKASDVRALEKYVDIWEPVQFLTSAEATKLIEDAKRR